MKAVRQVVARVFISTTVTLFPWVMDELCRDASHELLNGAFH